MKSRSIVEEKFWVERAEGVAKVGLTKEALASFGSVEWLKLPCVGERVQNGESAVIIESAKAAIEVESPVSGIVRDVNKDLVTFPKNLNEQAWLFVVEE